MHVYVQHTCTVVIWGVWWTWTLKLIETFCKSLGNEYRKDLIRLLQIGFFYPSLFYCRLLSSAVKSQN